MKSMQTLWSAGLSTLVLLGGCGFSRSHTDAANPAASGPSGANATGVATTVASISTVGTGKTSGVATSLTTATATGSATGSATDTAVATGSSTASGTGVTLTYCVPGFSFAADTATCTAQLPADTGVAVNTGPAPSSAVAPNPACVLSSMPTAAQAAAFEAAGCQAAAVACTQAADCGSYRQMCGQPAAAAAEFVPLLDLLTQYEFTSGDFACPDVMFLPLVSYQMACQSGQCMLTNEQRQGGLTPLPQP